jgi:DNA (cytosine-5)-methyltransferase 1
MVGAMSFLLLDLFCCAGGAAMGYHHAGFQVVGVDHKAQPHFPFEFYQADALEYLRENGERFDVIHASPPCQRYSCATPIATRCTHPDMIAETRAALQSVGKPYVIENVRGAVRLLRSPIMLCGTMFGLRVRRHRYFEIHPRIAPPILGCDHSFHPVVISGSAHGRGEAKVPEMKKAMGVEWMAVRREVREAIPPAFTEYIGGQLIALLQGEQTAPKDSA